MLKFVPFLLLGWLAATASPASGDVGQAVARKSSYAAIRGHSHQTDGHDRVPAGSSETLIEPEETDESSVKAGQSSCPADSFVAVPKLISSRMGASLDLHHPVIQAPARSAILRC